VGAHIDRVATAGERDNSVSQLSRVPSSCAVNKILKIGMLPETADNTEFVAHSVSLN
ncbi:unnamed protein product, partial [marine sediment metagenome]